MGLLLIFLGLVIAYFFIRPFFLSNHPPIEIAVEVSSRPDDAFRPNLQKENPDVSLYYFPVESVPRKINSQLRVIYESTSGEVTERTIDVNAFYRGEQGCIFQGFDHLRKSFRKLSSKCVKQAVDVETGEVIEDVVVFFEKQYLKSPEYLYDYIFELHGKEIYILIYLASADGSIKAKEREFITKYCLALHGFSAIDSHKFDELLKTIYRPSKYEFHKYVSSIGISETLWNCSNEIVNSNANPHTEQTRALNYILKRYKSNLQK